MATFGFSVGDFIAAITLVKDLIDALKDSGGGHQITSLQLLGSFEKLKMLCKGFDSSRKSWDHIRSRQLWNKLQRSVDIALMNF
jgi:hypothetical protein